MSNEATNKIESMIERTRERAKQAEKEFDRAAESIQRMASGSIDLFGGSAVSQVSDIAAESRKACDDLYASYQALIISLDEYCRPLLAEKPAASSVKAVAELMAWLNDESEIENNFTASLNGSGLGEVASKRYFASVESKMIQRYWEDKYHDIPEVIEAEAKKREAEATRRAEMDEKRKEWERERKEKYEKETEIYEQALSEWREETERIEAIQEEKIREKEAEVAQKEKDIKSKTQDEYNRCVNELEEKIKKCEDTVHEIENEVNKLGIFAFGKRTECKKRIQNEKEAIATLLKEIELEKKRYEEKCVDNSRLIEEMKQNIYSEIEEEYPFPEEPMKPKKPKETRSYASTYGATSVQELNECVKDEILDFLADGGLYTIAEMQEQSFTLGELSNQRVSALVRQLIRDGEVEKIEDNGVEYFRIA